MYRSPPPPPQDTHDDLLRTLLDQRSARADAHGRFSTVSEYTDTPSVYSRPNFSPKPFDNGENLIPSTLYDYPSPVSPQPQGFLPVRGQSTSMLDLDDDPRSSLALSESYEDDSLTAQDRGEELDATTRISYLGPKMRFHSRAPWELEGDPLAEEEEAEQSSRDFATTYPFSRFNESKPISSSRSSSPRPSFSSRPSAESGQYVYQLPPKRSFDTINSQVSFSRGALYALAQESLSTNSLARSTVPVKETLRSKFSLGRLKPKAPIIPLPPSPVRSRCPPSATGKEQHSFELTTRSTDNIEIKDKCNETMHPYANPDLVVSYAEDDSPISEHSAFPRNDSTITMTDSFSTDSVMKPFTPDTSVNSISSRHRASSVLSKNISSPVPVVGPTHRVDPGGLDNYSVRSIRPTISSLPGWTERNAAPTFSLISLEEARAQRSRSSTVTSPSRISSSSNSSTQFPTGDTDSLHNTNYAYVAADAHRNPSRARGRSISAGARARNVIHTIVGQQKPEQRESEPTSTHQSPSSAPTGKTLRHRKSGFMRLFNGGKVPEREDRLSPPPVPSLPDAVISSQPSQKTPKPPIHRIPVPIYSSSPREDAASALRTVSPSSENESWKINPSPKRTPLLLSINTISNATSSRSSTSQVHLGVNDKPWMSELPQSAPAHVSEFPTLRLRPISTLFSAQFGDHIVTEDSRSSEGTSDLDTPRSPSPNGLMSPITPFATARNDEKSCVPTSSVENQTDIKDLQERFLNSKKAWQRHIWELEGQVRDLKEELEELKSKTNGDYCQSCGRGQKINPSIPVIPPVSVINRPRARTGTSSRFGQALP